MPTPTNRDTAAWAEKETGYERLAEENAARTQYHCEQCGSLDGMRAQSYHSVRAIREPGSQYHQVTTWYRWPGDTHCLCYPCWYCNAGGRIPDGYVAMTEFEVDAWLAEQAEVEGET